MVKYDPVQIKGTEFVHAYSDQGFEIERDGQIYGDALDLSYLGYQYTETDIPIIPADENPTEEDYIEAAKILLGEDE